MDNQRLYMGHILKTTTTTVAAAATVEDINFNGINIKQDDEYDYYYIASTLNDTNNYNDNYNYNETTSGSSSSSTVNTSFPFQQYEHDDNHHQQQQKEDETITTQLSVDFGEYEILPVNETSCSICLVDYEHGDIVQRSAYNYYDASIQMDVFCDAHIFHMECIQKWMNSNSNNHDECPICRRCFVIGERK